MTEETHLIEWNSIKTAIAQCDDIKLISKMNYSIEAIQKWAKQSRQSLETQNEIAEYRLRLNRKQGEWIEANIPEEGSRGLIQEHLQATIFSRLSLADVGIDRNDSPKFRLLARIPEEKFEAYIQTTKENRNEITTIDACRLVDKAHVSYATGESEWYTPPAYIDAARQAMGSIDVDPASSDKANEIVKATTYYTPAHEGRTKVWVGNVWLNPPYTQPLVSNFCELLVQKYQAGEIAQACVLVNNATETGFYQRMLQYCAAVCFIKGRVKFIDEKGVESGAPLQGQTILYFGQQKDKFAHAFNRFGVILYAVC